MRIRTLALLACSLTILAPATQAQIFSDSSGPSTDSTASALKNPTTMDPAASIPQTPTIGGPFALTNQNGARITDANFRNSYMMVTFGYTRCGDSCSPSPAGMLRALGSLPAAQASRVIPVFVTLDPARDNPAALKNFLAQYGSRIVGLTGTPGEIDRMARSYSVYYKGVENPDVAVEKSLSPQDLAAWRRDPDYRQPSGEAYTIDHSQFIYVMGPDGQFVTVTNGNLPADNLTQALSAAIK